MSLESVCCLILGRRMGFLSNSDDPVRKEEMSKLATAVKNLYKSVRDSYYGVKLHESSMNYLLTLFIF